MVYFSECENGADITYTIQYTDATLPVGDMDKISAAHHHNFTHGSVACLTGLSLSKSYSFSINVVNMVGYNEGLKPQHLIILKHNSSEYSYFLMHDFLFKVTIYLKIAFCKLCFVFQSIRMLHPTRILYVW